jgi:hypothetical protein
MTPGMHNGLRLTKEGGGAKIFLEKLLITQTENRNIFEFSV